MAARTAMEKPTKDLGTVSRRSGARLGQFNATWPFTRLTADAKTLRLSLLGAPLNFTRESALELSAMRGYTSRGLQIRHADNAYPSASSFGASIRLGWTVS
jgi:hypothetical protein